MRTFFRAAIVIHVVVMVCDIHDIDDIDVVVVVDDGVILSLFFFAYQL